MGNYTRRKNALHRARNEAFEQRIDEIWACECGRYDFRRLRVADRLVFKNILRNTGAIITSFDEIYDELIFDELSQMRDEVLQNAVREHFDQKVLLISGSCGFECKYLDEEQKLELFLDQMAEQHAVVYI